MPVRILILPDAGPENPFQRQIIDLLHESGLEPVTDRKRILGTIYLSLQSSRADRVYFDWVHGFIVGKNLLWSLVKSSVFLLEIRHLKRRKIPFTHTLHNLQNHAGKWVALEKKVYAYFLSNCSLIRVYSEAVRQEAMIRFGLPAERFIVCPDPPYHHYYPNNITPLQARQRLNIESNVYVYLFFGEIKPYKGLEQLIKAFASVQETRCTLLIAGKSDSPEYLSSLQNLSSPDNRIRWDHRFIPDDQVQVYFNAADIVVLPFQKVDHSGTVDLAMSFKKAIITLKTTAMSQHLPSQPHLLFNSPDELSPLLIQALGHDFKETGEKNFRSIDTTSYKNLLRLFHGYSNIKKNNTEEHDPPVAERSAPN